MYRKKEKMRKREYFIKNLKIVDSIENLSLVTSEFRVLTTFLAIVVLQKHKAYFTDFSVVGHSKGGRKGRSRKRCGLTGRGPKHFPPL